MTKKGFIVWSLLLIGSLLSPVSPRAEEPSPPTRTIRAVRATSPIRVDGRLDEAAWALAKPSSSFRQRYPNPGADPTFKTEIKVLYNDKTLYIGVTCFDPEPDKIVRRMARRDREVATDAIELDIDSRNNHNGAYMFRLTAAGTRIDAQVYNEFNENKEWDALWEGKAALFKGGWMAEIAIPFSELRFTTKADMTFGFELRRDIERLQEIDEWAYIPPGSNRFVSAFGRIVGLKGIRASRSLQLTPFVVMKDRWHTRVPYFHRGGAFDAGLDFKLPLGTGFTLTGTVNPDFGQVEQDEVVLNLSTYETFYPEKRPFFMEGFQIFSPPGGLTLVHTRRIGTPPSAPSAPSGGTVVSAPERTTILGAAKVTGTTDGGLTVGAFTAVTQAERATVARGASLEKQLVAPQTTYSVLRVAQAFGVNSSVGFLGTMVNRQVGRDATVGALTWDLHFKKNKDIIRGEFARSSISQEEADDESGIGGSASWDHQFNKRWSSYGRVTYYDTHFDLNDMGFLRRNDYKQVDASVSYRRDDPTPRLLRSHCRIFGSYAINIEGDVLDRVLGTSASFTFPNYVGLWTDAGLHFARYDDRESRIDGLLFRRPATGWVSLGLETDDRKPITWEFSGDLSQENRGCSWELSGGPSGHPTDRSLFSVDLSYSRTHGDYRWADETWDAGGNPHSVFGDMSSREINITARASYVFTPDLTLDFYAQLFDASGHYGDFRELVAPDRFGPIAYAGSPDFHLAALNLNLVGRWEFKPDRTIYAVFSHGQAGALDPDEARSVAGMSPRRDLTLITSSPRDDIFLVKVAYRF